jgi:Flp pilus assembly protein TadD
MTEDLASGSFSEHLAKEKEVVAFGDLLLREGRTEQALKFFVRMACLFPESPTLCARLGEAYLHRGDRARAQESFRRSGELETNRRQRGQTR